MNGSIIILIKLKPGPFDVENPKCLVPFKKILKNSKLNGEEKLPHLWNQSSLKLIDFVLHIRINISCYFRPEILCLKVPIHPPMLS